MALIVRLITLFVSFSICFQGHSQSINGLDDEEAILLKEKLISGRIERFDTLINYRIEEVQIGVELDFKVVSVKPAFRTPHGETPKFFFLCTNDFGELMSAESLNFDSLVGESLSNVDKAILYALIYGVEDNSISYSVNDSIYLSNRSRLFQMNSSLGIFFRDRHSSFPTSFKNRYRLMTVVLNIYNRKWDNLTQFKLKFNKEGKLMESYRVNKKFAMRVGIPWKVYRKNKDSHVIENYVMYE